MRIAMPFEFGGAEGDRTPDLMTASHALSQLSYGPIKTFNFDQLHSSHCTTHKRTSLSVSKSSPQLKERQASGWNLAS